MRADSWVCLALKSATSRAEGRLQSETQAVCDGSLFHAACNIGHRVR